MPQYEENVKKIDVSIVIVNYNTYQLVLDCIRSIKEHTHAIRYEIIVVDNFSPDRSIEYLPRQFPEVHLILHTKNAGFGSANNIGAKHARGKYLLFLNSDTLLLNDAISELFKACESIGERLGVAGGNLYDQHQRPTLSYENIFPSLKAEIHSLFSDFFLRKIYKSKFRFNKTGKIIRINGFICGADFMLRRAVFNQMKGFDEDFFMYYEETELSHRIQSAGYGIFSIPQALIIHLEGGSQEKFSENKNRWMVQGRKLFYAKCKIKFYQLSKAVFLLNLFKSYIYNSILNRKNRIAILKNQIKMLKEHG